MMTIDEMQKKLEHFRVTRNEYVVAPADYPACMMRMTTDSEMLDFLFSPDLAALLTKAKADAEIVEELPKTADGVPVLPGMELFAGESARCWAGSMLEEDEEVLFSRWHQWYSTREAALAAHHTRKKSP